MRRSAVLLTALFLALAPVPACLAGGEDAYYGLNQWLSGFADPNTGLTAFPTLLIPMGGRLEGMGTAYTAVASDSGYLEANPSASSSLAVGELSFFHHGWIADSNLEGVVYTVRHNDLGLGLGGKFLYVPFTEYNDWGDRENRGYISETVATLNVSYNFMSSYDFHGLAVGANVKAAYRNIPAAFYPDQSALTAMLDVGVLTRFNFLKSFISRSPNFSVGAAVKNVGLPALGEPLPTVATLGIAYSPLRPLTWAFDFSQPMSFTTPWERWYFATGVSVVITDFLAMQTGVQWKADNPRVSLGSTVDLEKVSFVVNYNLDLSGRLNPLDKFSVEAKLNLGDRNRGKARDRVDALYLEGLQAYARGDLQGAIAKWEEILNELDPEFTPARESIETARRALQIEQRFDEELRLNE